MRRLFESLTVFMAMLAFRTLGYCWGHRTGRDSAREEMGPGFTQAARNGYEEGYEDARSGREETGPRLASL